MDVPILTIDGPSGAGKGTVSRLIAQQLGWHYLDSGAIYRALAIAITEKQVPLDDIAAIVDTAEAMNLIFECDATRHITLDGHDITQSIGLESTGNIASKIAAIPEIRAELLHKQQCYKELPGLVADGRDMGTVVFPHAQYKVFLTASALTRAKRRYKQLKEKGIDANLSKITADIQERDQRDSERAFSPLIAAKDAICIDSSDLSIEQVVESVLSLLHD